MTIANDQLKNSGLPYQYNGNYLSDRLYYPLEEVAYAFLCTTAQYPVDQRVLVPLCLTKTGPYLSIESSVVAFQLSNSDISIGNDGFLYTYREEDSLLFARYAVTEEAVFFFEQMGCECVVDSESGVPIVKSPLGYMLAFSVEEETESEAAGLKFLAIKPLLSTNTSK